MSHTVRSGGLEVPVFNLTNLGPTTRGNEVDTDSVSTHGATTVTLGHGKVLAANTGFDGLVTWQLQPVKGGPVTHISASAFQQSGNCIAAGQVVSSR